MDLVGREHVLADVVDKGWSSQLIWPTQSAMVERSKSTPSRA
jgi:hypothetical protein